MHAGRQACALCGEEHCRALLLFSFHYLGQQQCGCPGKGLGGSGTGNDFLGCGRCWGSQVAGLALRQGYEFIDTVQQEDADTNIQVGWRSSCGE